MKQNISLWQIFGFLFSSILGVILHFLYDRTDSAFVAMFSAVNESTWEHMKLIFFPMLLFSVIQYFSMEKALPGYWCIKLRGTLVGLVLIPILFYTLRGIFGTTPDWVNIAIFFVSLAAALIYELKLFKGTPILCKYCKYGFWVLCIIAVLFAVFTFMTPHIPLFQDPIDGSFGI